MFKIRIFLRTSYGRSIVILIAWIGMNHHCDVQNKTCTNDDLRNMGLWNTFPRWPKFYIVYNAENKILENRHLHIFGMQHSNEMQIWSGTNEEPWSMMGSNDYKRLLWGKCRKRHESLLLIVGTNFHRVYMVS